MEERIRWFRTQVAMHFGGRPGRGARYPAALRSEAVDLVRGAAGRGVGLGRIAQRLGVASATLERWLEQAVEPGAARDLRPVEIVAADAARESPSAPRLILVTAAGHRVEGLVLEEVAALLEALG